MHLKPKSISFLVTFSTKVSLLFMMNPVITPIRLSTGDRFRSALSKLRSNFEPKCCVRPFTTITIQRANNLHQDERKVADRPMQTDIRMVPIMPLVGRVFKIIAI